MSILSKWREHMNIFRYLKIALMAASKPFCASTTRRPRSESQPGKVSTRNRNTSIQRFLFSVSWNKASTRG